MIGRQRLITNICVFNPMRQQHSELFYSIYRDLKCRLKGYLEAGELAADSIRSCLGVSVVSKAGWARPHFPRHHDLHLATRSSILPDEH